MPGRLGVRPDESGERVPRTGRTGSKAERDALRQEMLVGGCSLELIAAEMERRWGFRPREAYRHAHGWSQDEVAARFTEVAERLGGERDWIADRRPVPSAPMIGTRIGEYERWPRGGRRPSPYVLTVLATVLGTTVERLLDYDDHRKMPDQERTVLAAVLAASTPPVPPAAGATPLRSPPAAGVGRLPAAGPVRAVQAVPGGQSEVRTVPARPTRRPAQIGQVGQARQPRPATPGTLATPATPAGSAGQPSRVGRMGPTGEGGPTTGTDRTSQPSGTRRTDQSGWNSDAGETGAAGGAERTGPTLQAGQTSQASRTDRAGLGELTGPATQAGKARQVGQVGRTDRASRGDLTGPAGRAGEVGQAGPPGQASQTDRASRRELTGPARQAGAASQASQVGHRGRVRQLGPADQAGRAHPAEVDDRVDPVDPDAGVAQLPHLSPGPVPPPLPEASLIAVAMDPAAPDAASAARRHRRDRLLSGPPDTLPTEEEVIMDAAGQSAEFGEWAEATNVGSTTLEQLDEDVRQIARSYLNGAPLPLMLTTLRVRNRVFALLEGRQHPAQTRRLYVTAGRLCGLLGWMAGDVGRHAEAETQARTGWLCAELADADALRAWIRATQSKVAYWDGRMRESARLAEDGLRFTASDTAGVLLASLGARAWARLGDADAAHAALGRAEDERARAGEDEVGGLLGFSEAQQSYLAGTTHLWLQEPVEALRAADRAVWLYGTGDQAERFYGAEMLALIDAATAHLQAGELESAGEKLAPVLALPREQRLETFTQRLGEMRDVLRRSRHATSRPAVDIQHQIEDFRSGALGQYLGR